MSLSFDFTAFMPQPGGGSSSANAYLPYPTSGNSFMPYPSSNFGNFPSYPGGNGGNSQPAGTGYPPYMPPSMPPSNSPGYNMYGSVSIDTMVFVERGNEIDFNLVVIANRPTIRRMMEQIPLLRNTSRPPWSVRSKINSVDEFRSVWISIKPKWKHWIEQSRNWTTDELKSTILFRNWNAKRFVATSILCGRILLTHRIFRMN